MHTRDIALPSNRRFGVLMGAIAVGLAGYFCFAGQQAVALPLGIVGAVVLLAAIARPALLLPFNKAWMTLGLLLGRVVSPLVLGVIFYGLITPVALALRLAGRDELRLKRSPSASYWRTREGPGPEPASFDRQY